MLPSNKLTPAEKPRTKRDTGRSHDSDKRRGSAYAAVETAQSRVGGTSWKSRANTGIHRYRCSLLSFWDSCEPQSFCSIAEGLRLLANSRRIHIAEGKKLHTSKG